MSDDLPLGEHVFLELEDVIRRGYRLDGMTDEAIAKDLVSATLVFKEYDAATLLPHVTTWRLRIAEARAKAAAEGRALMLNDLVLYRR